MSATTSPSARGEAASVVALLRARDPRLTAFGLACLLAGLVALALPIVDGRLLDGVPVWLKPAKFFASVGLFALTTAWFTGYVRPERRDARPLRVGRALLIGAGGFELGYITVQAALGEASHFNTGDPVHGILYALMGLGALTLLASKLPLAYEIARWPASGLDRSLRLAILLGLSLTVLLGGATGIAISLNQGHGIGRIGAGLPLLGWNRSGGDLRVAHFFGMHAEQALPLAAAALAALRLPGRSGLVALTAAVLVAVTAFAWIEARAGIAFPLG